MIMRGLKGSVFVRVYKHSFQSLCDDVAKTRNAVVIQRELVPSLKPHCTDFEQIHVLGSWCLKCLALLIDTLLLDSTWHYTNSKQFSYPCNLICCK